MFFVQTLRDGTKAVMARYYGRGQRDAVPFYLLIPEARIKAQLDMGQTVDKAVQAAFPGAWQETWRRIMVRGLRITS